jgi:hypothetical protein
VENSLVFKAKTHLDFLKTAFLNLAEELNQTARLRNAKNNQTPTQTHPPEPPKSQI